MQKPLMYQFLAISLKIFLKKALPGSLLIYERLLKLVK